MKNLYEIEHNLELSDPYELGFAVFKKPSIEENISFIVRNDFTFARVPATTEIYEILAEYNAGAVVNAIEYSRTIKRIRGMMIQKKNEMRGYKNGQNFNR
jgi:hypothetical protein